MTANQWPDDAQLDALIEAASHTKSQAIRFDPEAPGGFRALTEQEDADLIDAIRLPAQRHDDDREHLTRERNDAERGGDRDGAETAAAHLEVLDEERARDTRSDPLPTREELDAMEVSELTGTEARAWGYLDARRDIAEEREQAETEADPERVTELDAERDAVDRTYLAALDPEIDDDERER